MLANKELPNKWIRKAIYDELNDSTVNGKNIRVFDQRIPVEEAPEAYIILAEQTAEPRKDQKCAYNWSATLQMEVITQTAKAGNTGSRLLLNDVTNLITQSFNTLYQLDPGSNQSILTQNVECGTDFVSVAGSYLIYRQPLAATFYIV